MPPAEPPISPTSRLRAVSSPPLRSPSPEYSPTPAMSPAEELHASQDYVKRLEAELASERAENRRLKARLDRHCAFTCQGGWAESGALERLASYPDPTMQRICRFESPLPPPWTPAHRRQASHPPPSPGQPATSPQPSLPATLASLRTSNVELATQNAALQTAVQEAHERADDLKRESDAKSLFIATVSHELRLVILLSRALGNQTNYLSVDRTPLNGILGMVSSLLHGHEADREPEDDPLATGPGSAISAAQPAYSSLAITSALSPPTFPAPGFNATQSATPYSRHWSTSSASTGRLRNASSGAISVASSGSRSTPRPEGHLSADQLESVQIIKDCADELLRTVDDVLLFSKSQAGMLTLTTHAFPIFDEIIVPVLRILELRAWTKGIELIYDPHLESGRIVSDAAKLRTALTNLLTNSIKFTESGFVKVTVITRLTESDPPAAELSELTVPSRGSTSSSPVPPRSPVPSSSVPEERRGELEIRVQDTGIGIPEEKRGMLFKSFSQVVRISRAPFLGEEFINRLLSYRIPSFHGFGFVERPISIPCRQDGTFRPRYEGTGLGLSIVRTLVELMGGSIDFSSEYGKGSTFWFVVPVGIIEEPESERQGGSTSLAEVSTASTSTVKGGMFDPQETPRAQLHDPFEALKRDLHAELSAYSPSSDTPTGSHDPPPNMFPPIDPEFIPFDSAASSSDLSDSSTWSPHLRTPSAATTLSSSVTSVSEPPFSPSRASLTGEINSQIRERARESSETERMLAEGKKPTIRVLVAEDNLVGAKVVHKFLKRLGYADVYFGEFAVPMRFGDLWRLTVSHDAHSFQQWTASRPSKLLNGR